jgi:hydroxypyruvate isomerase
MYLKQSVSWWCFTGRGVEDHALLQKCKEIGYAAVELVDPSLFPAVRDAGLEIASHSGPGGLNDPAEHNAIARSVDSALEVAVKYQIPNLIVFSGNRREGVSDKEAAEHTAAGLARIAPAAEAVGVTLVMELLNSRVDHVGYQCDTSQWGTQVCKAVNSPCVKLLYDIYHMQIMEGDLVRHIEENHHYYGHYHTAGNPGRHDLDTEQEINYAAVFRAIRKVNYQGYIGHEFLPKGDPVLALESAYRLVIENS